MQFLWLSWYMAKDALPRSGPVEQERYGGRARERHSMGIGWYTVVFSDGGGRNGGEMVGAYSRLLVGYCGLLAVRERDVF